MARRELKCRTGRRPLAEHRGDPHILASLTASKKPDDWFRPPAVSEEPAPPGELRSMVRHARPSRLSHPPRPDPSDAFPKFFIDTASVPVILVVVRRVP
jgi:hypothetical protein